MRKKLFLFLILTPFLAFGQANKSTWDYPVKPGTEAWKNLKNYDEKVESCQMPEEAINELKTAELISICLDYPLLPAVYAFNNINDGFNKFENDFNGFRALLNRQDAGKEIIKLYKMTPPEEIENKQAIIDKGAYIVRLSLIELFISNQQILQQLTVLEKKDILHELIEKKEKKKLNSSWDTRLGVQVNYLAMINIVESGNDNSLDLDYNVLKFIYYGTNETTETKAEIEKIVNNYLK